MPTEQEIKFYRKTYDAWKDSEQKTASRWIVGVPQFENGITNGENLIPSKHWSKLDANRIAQGVNKAIDNFITENKISTFSEKLIFDKSKDPNKLLPDRTKDRVGTWLTNTDHLLEETSGSIPEEIKRLRDILISAIKGIDDLLISQDNEGTWRIRSRIQK